MKKLIIAVVVIAVVAVGVYAVLTRGGGEAKFTAMGKAIPQDMKPLTVSEALEHAAEHPGMEAVIKGEMVRKCPTSGCWFYLGDGTGSIRVDLQFAGFNVLDQSVGSRVTLYGKLMKPKDGDAQVSALGAEF